MNILEMIHLKTVTGNQNTDVLTVTVCMMVITVNAVDTIFIMEECNMRLCTIVFSESSSSRTRKHIQDTKDALGEGGIHTEKYKLSECSYEGS